MPTSALSQLALKRIIISHVFYEEYGRARPASGAEHIEAAKELLHAARTAAWLRQAQAVLLPLEWGLSLEQTACAIGIREYHVCDTYPFCQDRSRYPEATLSQGVT